MENIRYGKLDAQMRKSAAARFANADTFIQQLRNGYDTLLTGDGASLCQDSVGCRHRQELPSPIRRF